MGGGQKRGFALVNARSGAVVAERITLANRWWSRLRGLIGRRRLDPGEALVLTPCSAIHTLGMRFAIDALFLDRDWVIRRAVTSVKPWRIGPVCPGSVYVVELPVGTIQRFGLEAGVTLRLVPRSDG
ncbi:MAG: DUF192 domain-containing protein [Thermomicrobium sp.]|nr:DUF192 domain-containing protein [Thermomicrobium sp.]MDW7982726.1 DUF192 domain-containing protein [Thermomicrobium sp.]